MSALAEMIHDKAWCHRCNTVFSIRCSLEDYDQGIGYGECPQCHKSGKFGLAVHSDEVEEK